MLFTSFLGHMVSGTVSSFMFWTAPCFIIYRSRMFSIVDLGKLHVNRKVPYKFVSSRILYNSLEISHTTILFALLQ